MSLELKGALEIRHEGGADAVIAAWQGLVANRIAPNAAVMASLT
jgi:hypothetical protein